MAKRQFKPETEKRRNKKTLLKFLSDPKVEIRHLEIRNEINTHSMGGYQQFVDTGFRTITLSVRQEPKRKYKKG